MKKGFTLIEIMVVITIMGILIAMVAGSFMASQKKGRDLKRKSDISQVAKALEFFYNDNGRYPATNNGVMTACGDPASLVDCTPGQEWSTSTTPPTVYMATLPSDPTGQTYYYSTDAGGTFFQIYARLENTQDQDIKRSGSTMLTYEGTNCGGIECNYGFSSPNTTPNMFHGLH